MAEDDVDINPYTDDSEVLTDDEKAYSDAFSEMQKPQVDEPDATDDTVVEGESDAVVGDGEPAVAGDDTVASDDAAPDQTVADADNPAPMDETPPAPAAADQSQIIEELQAQIEQLKQAQQTAQAPQPQPEPEAPTEQKPLYTDDEQQLLKQYAEDWGDVQRGEALTRRAEYQQLVQYIFDQIHGVYGPALDYVEGRSGRDQYADIKARVDDYDDVRDKAIEWAGQQPEYLKAAYQQVIDNGTAEEVAHFINLYKQATNYGKTAPAPAASVAPAPAAPTPDPKKAAAAAALRVVKTKRSEDRTEPDANDFSAAFKEFAAMK
jgi:hypothetical protein